MGTHRVGHSAARDNATEHINALGEFATELATWLKRFASGLYEYQQTERYQKARQAPQHALEQRGHKRKSWYKIKQWYNVKDKAM